FEEVERLGDAGAGEAGKPGGIRFLARGEEDSIVRSKAEFVGELAHLLRPVVLGDGAAPFTGLARRVSQPGETLLARPVVHVVEELAAVPGGLRSGDRTDCAAAVDDLGEQVEARAF